MTRTTAYSAAITGAGGDVVVPGELDGFTVDVIGVSVFRGETITSLTLPETVLELRSNAISTCDNLTRVSLPQSLVVINRMNFFSCNALTEVTIPAGVRYIGDASFRYCDSLRKITFEGVCPAIDIDCFSLLPEGATAYVPDDQLDAYIAAFENTGSEVSVQPSGKNAVIVENNGYVESEFDFDASTGTITSYNGYATYMATPKPSGGAPVKAIGPEAFAHHTYLALLKLPEGLETIGDRAFYNCETLARVHFPSTLKFIGDNAVLQLPTRAAFWNCLRGWSISANTPSILPASKAFWRCPRGLKPSAKARLKPAATWVAISICPRRLSQLAPAPSRATTTFSTSFWKA